MLVKRNELLDELDVVVPVSFDLAVKTPFRRSVLVLFDAQKAILS